MNEKHKALEEDIKFLLDRQERAGSRSFGGGRDTGISSNALVRYAYLEYTGLSAPDISEYPEDPPDLAACFRAYAKLPRHRKSVEVTILLAAFADRVADKYRDAVIDMFHEHPEWESVYSSGVNAEQKMKGEQ